MKRAATVMFAVLLAPALGASLHGCSSTPKKTETTPKPVVNEMVVATQPAATTPAASAPAGQPAERPLTEEQRMAQLLASRGEDIPIKEAPVIAFSEPGAEDKQVFKPVYFDYDKSNIKPEYQPVLEAVAKWMTKNPSRQLLIEGHCDERGTDEYNLALGERRALAVRRYLVALGVVSDRVHTISYGEEKPAVPGSTEAAWSKNRRAEFKVSTQ